MATYVNLVGVSQSMKKCLIGKTIEKLSGKYDWTHIYHHRSHGSIQIIMKNDTQSFEDEKNDFLKTGRVTYTLDANTIDYKVSKTYTLVLKPHRFEYKPEESYFNPLAYELEGLLSCNGLVYYELIKIDEH